MLALKDFFCSTLVWSGGSNLPIKSAQKHNPTVGNVLPTRIYRECSTFRFLFNIDSHALIVIS